MAVEVPREEMSTCSQVPSLVSAFVDTFVDFAVGGQFLAPQTNPSSVPGNGPKSGAQEGATGLAVHDKVEDEPQLVTRIPAPERLIAVGDIHGDLRKAKEALRIAQVMDEKERWIGGRTVVVQVGDLLDRGGEEIKVMYFLEKLKAEARKQGGDVHIMNGNHEVMNIEGDFRYATTEGFDEFRRWAEWQKLGGALKERCNGLEKPYDFFKNIPEHFSEGCRARMAALRPGGPIASRFLASHPTVLVVGGTVFVHGGLLPAHVELGLENINEETRQWMRGKRGWFGPDYLRGGNAVVWLRKYSTLEESGCDCALLVRALAGVQGAERMVVGHTIQESLGVNAVCSNKVVRVDVGLSKGCGDGAPEVLEIRDDTVMTKLSAGASLRMMNAEETSAYNKGRQERPGLASLLSPNPEGRRVPVDLQTIQNL